MNLKLKIKLPFILMHLQFYICLVVIILDRTIDAPKEHSGE